MSFRRPFFRRAIFGTARPLFVHPGLPLRPLQSKIGVVPILAGAAAIGSAAWFTAKSAAVDSKLPPLLKIINELDVESATEILRKEEYSGTFGSATSEGTQHGTFFKVRHASNSPVEDEYAFGSAPGVDNGLWEFWGVFDGHAGFSTSAVLRKSLIPYVSHHLKPLPPTSSKDSIISAIKRSFTALDSQIFQTATAALSSPHPASPSTISAIAPALAGSCALLSLYNPASSTLFTACTGDSRAVLGRYDSGSHSYAAEPLSVDQTGKNKSEFDRVMAQHPNEPDCVNPTSGRVLGLAVTRAFGDSRWKWSNDTQQRSLASFFGQAPLKNAKTQPYLTAEPEVSETKIEQGDFLILATDGLWDHISSDDAVACVSAWVAAVRAGRIVASSTANPHPAFRRSKAAASAAEDAYELEDGRYADWKATPRHFVVEDSNVATHLVKNAFGGSRRGLFAGVMTSYPGMSRYVRDDVTVQVVFFGDALAKKGKA